MSSTNSNARVNVVFGQIVSEPSAYNKINCNGKRYGNISCRIRDKFGVATIVEARLYLGTKKQFSLAVGNFIALHVIRSGKYRGLVIVRPLTEENIRQYGEQQKIVEYNNTKLQKLMLIAEECDLSGL